MSVSMLEPRRVEKGAIFWWARLSLGLMRRRPFSFAAATLGIALFMGLLPLSAVQMASVFVWPFVVGVFFLVARAADKSEPLDPLVVVEALAEHVQVLLRLIALLIAIVLIVLAILFPFFYAMGGLINLFVDGGAEETVRTIPIVYTPFQKVFLSGTIVTWMLSLFMQISGLWFAVPLVLSHGAGANVAWKKSEEARHLNGSIFTQIFLLVMSLSWFSLRFGGILGMLLLPLFGTMLYVAYRDVFLGARENARVPVAVAAALPHAA